MDLTQRPELLDWGRQRALDLVAAALASSSDASVYAEELRRLLEEIGAPADVEELTYRVAAALDGFTRLLMAAVVALGKTEELEPLEVLAWLATYPSETSDE